MSEHHSAIGGSAVVGLNPISRLVKIRLSDGARWVVHEMAPDVALKLADDLRHCAAAAEAPDHRTATVNDLSQAEVEEAVRSVRAAMGVGVGAETQIGIGPKKKP